MRCLFGRIRKGSVVVTWEPPRLWIVVSLPTEHLSRREVSDSRTIDKKDYVQGGKDICQIAKEVGFLSSGYH